MQPHKKTTVQLRRPSAAAGAGGRRSVWARASPRQPLGRPRGSGVGLKWGRNSFPPFPCHRRWPGREHLFHKQCSCVSLLGLCLVSQRKETERRSHLNSCFKLLGCLKRKACKRGVSAPMNGLNSLRVPQVTEAMHGPSGEGQVGEG